jgi:hypothetical protein
VDTPKFGEDGTPKPPRKMLAVRDIRENNQSAGSRVEREAILSVLPAWYVEMGIAACYATLAGNSAEPLEDRRRKAILHFEARHGVTRAMLEAKVGTSSDQWVDLDLAQLRVADLAITRGESTVDVEFRGGTAGAPAPKANGATRTTAADLAPPVDTAPVDSPEGDAPGDSTDTVDTEPKPTKAQLNEMFALMTGAGLKGKAAADRAARLRLTTILVGHDVETSDQLTAAEVAHIVAVLKGFGDNAQEEVATMLAEDADDQRQAEADLAEPADDASGEDS